MNRHTISIPAAVALALGLGACVSTPQPDAVLERAQAAVQSAAADPNVAQYAPLDLEAAKKHLAAAEAASAQRDEQTEDQEGYLAAQTARLAQVRAQAKADDAYVARGGQERNRIQLEARTREARQAQYAAQQAQSQVQQAQSQAQQAQSQAQQAELQNARLQEEIDKLKATPTPRGLLLTLGDVLFDTGRAELNPGASTKLDQLAQFLTEHPDRRVEIDGFTDSTGSPGFNEELSQRRAEAVKAALVLRGVDSSRINAEGFGSANPVASNNNVAGRQLNRRVEVVIGNGDNQPIAPRG
jgi:outer membrane protein OmpA-like peptidoglycan-associated protein